MNKTWIIIQREYLTRVKKKSFIILTFLMPVLMGAMMFLPAWLASRDSTDTKQVAVIDYTGMIVEKLNNNKTVHYTAVDAEQEEDFKTNLEQKGYFALLVIPEDVANSSQVDVYGLKQVNIDLKDNINWQVRQIVEKSKLTAIYAEANIPDLEKRIADTKTRIKVNTYKLGKEASDTKEGGADKPKESSTEAAMAIAYASGFIIYMFIFMYGGMVMRGVVEEKQNRIVEVIISSVKPIQLMMGKIVGIVAVGLTQVAIWAILISVISSSLPSSDILTAVLSIEMGAILFGFVAYFILGYLLYSSLMAAVAAAVDSQEDMQQFMVPIMLPLIMAIMILMYVIKSPDGALAVWTSYIPFLSPVIMMARIPHGVEWWELAISLTLLIATTLGCIWVAAKIYRTGILMYGKKPSWKELGKWITYKN